MIWSLKLTDFFCLSHWLGAFCATCYCCSSSINQKLWEFVQQLSSKTRFRTLCCHLCASLNWISQTKKVINHSIFDNYDKKTEFLRITFISLPVCRGSKPRRVWYLLHWIMGTAISFFGVFNIYTGLKAYNRRTSKSTSLWTALFTAQVIFMAFFYLFQDKWDYIQRQGAIHGNETTTPSSVQGITQEESNKEASTTEPRMKNNALGAYFSRSNALNKLFQLT